MRTIKQKLNHLKCISNYSEYGIYKNPNWKSLDRLIRLRDFKQSKQNEVMSNYPRSLRWQPFPHIEQIVIINNIRFPSTHMTGIEYADFLNIVDGKYTFAGESYNTKNYGRDWVLLKTWYPKDL